MESAQQNLLGRLRLLQAFFHTLKLGGMKKTTTRFLRRLRFTHHVSRAVKGKSPVNYAQDFGKSLFATVEPATVLREIRRTGLFTGFNLAPETVSAIWDFVKANPCVGGFGDPEQAKTSFFPHERALAEKHLGSKLIMGHYPEIVARSPIVRAIAEDPKVLAVASEYLGTTPKNSHTMLWWSFATEANEQARLNASQTVRFHFDEFDYRFLYFSFYLTNVDENSGAHVCVLGSHTKKSLVHLLSPASQSDDAIYKYYGKQNIVTLTGKAGLGFVEDAFCFHKATAPKTSDRLFLQLRFGSSDAGK